MLHPASDGSRLLVLVGVLVLASGAAAQSTPTGGVQPTQVSPPASQYVMTGRLEQRDQQFVLLGGTGQLEAILVPRKSLDLDRYRGQLVKATVREPLLRTGHEPRLWVEQIESASASAPASWSLFDAAVPGRIALAQYTEPSGVEPCPPAPIAVTNVVMSDSCGPKGWIWGNADYLLWWTSGMSLPPLVTTSPLGTPREDAGVLGEPGTRLLYGNEDVLTGAMHGVRLRAGVWFDLNHRWGVQGEYFSLLRNTSSYTATSDAGGDPILARPFFNINPRDPFTNALDPPAREDAQLISYPDVLRGSISIEADTRFESAGIAFRALLACDSFCNPRGIGYSRVDLVAGYRYLCLSEQLTIQDPMTSLLAELPVSFNVYDRFATRNQFHGLDIGMAWQAGWQRWSLELAAKTAVGTVMQDVTIDGGTTLTAPDVASTNHAGGLLALPSNMGTYSQNHWTLVPELNATVRFAVLPRLHATAAYTLIYWGTVVRPGDHIDMDVNPDQLPPAFVPLAGALRPEFSFRETDYWAHGLSVGLEGRW